MITTVLIALFSLFVQTPPTAAIVDDLRTGGFVIVMRHASSPADLPTTETASAGNTTLERQLDAEGRRAATALGAALRRLRIPVGQVLVSPAYRTRETARLAALASPVIVPEIGEAAGSMQAVTPAQIAWLQRKVTERPDAGTNTWIVTHSPNIVGAFPAYAAGIAQGEAIVFQPSGTRATVVGRIKITEWP